MKQAIKLACLLLALVMCLGAVVACADEAEPEQPSDQNNQTNTNTDTTPTPEEEEDDTVDLLAQLPAYNFNGDEFVILCREDKEYEIDTKENGTGDLVNDAVFARNARIGELYNVDIVSAPIEGTWQQRATFMTHVRTSVAGGSDDYDLIAGYMAYISELAQDGNFHDLHQVDTLNLENEWWSQSFNENLTVYDKLYFADGDASLTMWESLYAMYFNKQIAENEGIDDLYEVVRDGDWTLEYLLELTENMYRDDDGNDVADMEDSYGMIINCHSVRALVTTCGIPVTERNEDDEIELVFYNERTTNFFLDVYHFIHENDGVYMMNLADDSDYTDILRIFTSDRALFISGTLDQSAVLRGMDTDFGIIPLPKYNDDQENYLAHSYDGHSIFCIPASLVDTKMSGAILDALGAESRQSVVPEYYEVVLKGRTSRDEESAEMLNIIRENLFFDFAFVHNNDLDKVWSQIGDMMEKNQKIVASSFAAKADGHQKLLEQLLEKYDALS